MSNDISTHGDFDRADETQDIRDNPPAAIGNPGGSTLADSLEDLFVAKIDHHVQFPATAPNGAELILEFDTELTGEEFNRYQKIAQGNRAARRGGAGSSDVKPWLSAAAMLSEKSTRITHKATGKVYQDPKGHPLTLVSEEWLTLAGAPADPINANLLFFGFPQVIALGNAYMRATGLDNEVDAVDPTNG